MSAEIAKAVAQCTDSRKLDEGLTRHTDAPGFSIDRPEQVNRKVSIHALNFMPGTVKQGRASTDIWFMNARCVVPLGLLLWLVPGVVLGQPKCLESWNSGLHLEGRIGNAEVRAYLLDGYPAEPPNGVSGVFFYTQEWLPLGEASAIGLDGQLSDDCEVHLTERGAIGREAATWVIGFTTDNQLAGARREEQSSASVPITLRMVAPIDCSGRGTWRRFSSDRWPITFEYPVSWRLEERSDGLVLQCPDPGRLAFGGAPIHVEVGAGAGEAVQTEDGRRGTRIGGFLRLTGDQWWYGYDACEEVPRRLFCEQARRSTRRGMTVLQASVGEDRLYRPGGGYVGQGPGVLRYAFLLRDSWVTVDSQDPPDWLDTIHTPGPVIFDGDGVTERMVRSIRPR